MIWKTDPEMIWYGLYHRQYLPKVQALCYKNLSKNNLDDFQQNRNAKDFPVNGIRKILNVLY